MKSAYGTSGDGTEAKLALVELVAVDLVLEKALTIG
jgi:hypothetical protein